MKRGGKVNLSVRPLSVACYVSAADVLRKDDIDEVTLALTIPLFKRVKRCSIVVNVPAGKGKRLVEHIVNTRLIWDD